MAFTYDATLSTDLAKVRFLIPDTEASAYDLTDAEIGYVLTRASDATEAAAQCCEQISRNYAIRGMATRSSTFADRAKELRLSVATTDPFSAAAAYTVTIGRVEYEDPYQAPNPVDDWRDAQERALAREVGA
jgi:hypothetical protein